MSYVELQVSSNFSFLRGASHPDELVVAAAALGHKAIAITDRNSLAGMVRAHEVAKETGIRLVVGCRLDLQDGVSLLCFPTDRAAYGRLTRLLTLGKRRAPKGECHLGLKDLPDFAPGQIAVLLPPIADEAIQNLRGIFKDGCYLAAQNHLTGTDAETLRDLAAQAERCGLELVATNDVHYHHPDRRVLQDVMTCIREHCTIDQAGWRLFPNAERCLKSAEEMASLFADYPKALTRSAEIAKRCAFSLDELRYEYPTAPMPEGSTPQQELERLTWEGAAERYPDGLDEKIRKQLRYELDLIAQMQYAPYFLTVHDIVRFARSQGILCQGRGSAANSAVCYCIGITSVDPTRADLLFERFISAERNEPPDIDVDFEHQRREEVIQYIYERYGRDRAGIAATVITYRSRSAIREVGKALGLSQDVVGALSGTIWGMSRAEIPDEHVRQAGLDPADPRLRLALDLADQIKGFPRHLSQHVGGFVLTRGPLDEVVPIANAAMEDRTFIEWDKDDLDRLGILKIDVLALGMLSCLRRGLDLLRQHHGLDLTLATVPPEDAATYDMLCKADSLGVFQVESRAQMAMLPRLQPRSFYDLVIQVAIVRPGPIQGDMVHPYLRRRAGSEKVTYPSVELKRVLHKTLGVPLFQEQAMRIAIEAAGFTPAEADRLRRAMAAWRRAGVIHTFREKFIAGMVGRGYDQSFAERCFQQIEGFGEYGFPESHSASFALLVYVSSWLKRHYPAAFACALLNSQPMGFYAPAQIVRDARAHGVEVRPADVNHSEWDCTLEKSGRFMALRLGLRQVVGLREADAKKLLAARGGGYADIHDLWRRARLSPVGLELLAKADCFGSMGLNRRQALWEMRGLRDDPLPLFAAAERRPEPQVFLPDLAPGEQVVEDYNSLRLSLRQHPLALLRQDFRRDGITPCSALGTLKSGKKLKVAGLAITRQRPGTASGIIFLTIEDESGIANVIIRPPVFEAHRAAVMGGHLVVIEGVLQREGIVIHLLADKVHNRSEDLRKLVPSEDLPPIKTPSRDFQ